MKILTSGERRGLILLALILLMLGAAVAICDRRPDRDNDLAGTAIVTDDVSLLKDQPEVNVDTLAGQVHKEDAGGRVGRRKKSEAKKSEAKKSGSEKSGKPLRQPLPPRRPLDQPVN